MKNLFSINKDHDGDSSEFDVTPYLTARVSPEIEAKLKGAFSVAEEAAAPRELSEEDKLIVARARKIQRFLSQPFSVAEQFTGMEGRYVPIKETIRGFKEIIEGKHDDLPESAFLFVGTIDEAVEKAKKLKEA